MYINDRNILLETTKEKISYQSRRYLNKYKVDENPNMKFKITEHFARTFMNSQKLKSFINRKYRDTKEKILMDIKNKNVKTINKNLYIAFKIFKILS